MPSGLAVVHSLISGGFILYAACMTGKVVQRNTVAAVAQLVESQIVILVVAGSSPVGRPNSLVAFIRWNITDDRTAVCCGISDG